MVEFLKRKSLSPPTELNTSKVFSIPALRIICVAKEILVHLGSRYGFSYGGGPR